MYSPQLQFFVQLNHEEPEEPEDLLTMSYRGRGRGGYRNNNSSNGYNSFNQNNVEQFAVANQVPVEILGWNGATVEDCIKFISRKCRIAVMNPTVDQSTGILKGYVRNMKEADELCSWSGVRFSGQPLKIAKAVSANSISNTANISGGNSTLEALSQFVKSRYNPEAKFLNLSAVQQDSNLVSKGFFASISTTSKFFPALMKVAGELKLSVDSVDLSFNNLTDLTTISSLTQTFPGLKNLSLQNNNLARLKLFEAWRHKLNFLRELVLTGNPLINLSKQEDFVHLRNEILRVFPRLVVLNGEIVRNEQALLNILHFPFDTPQPMFFQDSDIQNISTNFVTNFYNLWDGNRRELSVLYQQNSQFSMQVDSAHPFMIDGKSAHSSTDFGYYIPQSRNLTRVSSVKSRASRVASGPADIMNIFSQLPKTRHELINKPYLFSMESYSFPPLNGVMIVLHGSFEEVAQPENLDALKTNQNGPRRFNHKTKKIPLGTKSFDRSFLVLPGPNGSMIVASDLLLIRPFGGHEAFEGNGMNGGIPLLNIAPGNPPSHSPTPTPTPTPTTLDLPPEVKANLNQIQQEILVRVLLETKLNMQYGIMLCEQSNWNYDQSIINFKNSVESLPREAYAN